MNERFTFSIEKSKKLKAERGISFEECIELIEAGHVVDVVNHPNQTLHPGQKLILLNVNGYIYTIPISRSDDVTVLHTIYQSRKHTRDYLKGAK